MSTDELANPTKSLVVVNFQKDEIEAGEQEVANKSDQIKTIKERSVL
jgi:hypothetical protein